MNEEANLEPDLAVQMSDVNEKLAVIENELSHRPTMTAHLLATGGLLVAVMALSSLFLNSWLQQNFSEIRNNAISLASIETIVSSNSIILGRLDNSVRNDSMVLLNIRETVDKFEDVANDIVAKQADSDARVSESDVKVKGLSDNLSTTTLITSGMVNYLLAERELRNFLNTNNIEKVISNGTQVLSIRAAENKTFPVSQAREFQSKVQQIFVRRAGYLRQIETAGTAAGLLD